MAFGLVLSVVLMGLAASVIARIINKHRWIAVLGIVIIVFAGTRMIWEDAHNFFPGCDPCDPELPRRRSLIAEFSRLLSWSARVSGVSTGAKVSSKSITGRISISLLVGIGLGQRFTPSERFVHVFDFPKPIAGDDFLGFGEWPVGDGAALAVEQNAFAE